MPNGHLSYEDLQNLFRKNWKEPYMSLDKLNITRAPNMDCHAVAEIPQRKEIAQSDMKAWAGGAKRSAPMPDWWMSPWRAWKGMLSRFTIGKKYGINNWKKALNVPKTHWHDGEDYGESALDFVRQFVAHGFEHLTNAFALADKPRGAVIGKGDNLMENLYAYLWNAATLVEYAIENEDMFREAFSQYPEGSPLRRQDLNPSATLLGVLQQLQPQLQPQSLSLGDKLLRNIGAEPADVKAAVERVDEGVAARPDVAPVPTVDCSCSSCVALRENRMKLNHMLNSGR